MSANQNDARYSSKGRVDRIRSDKEKKKKRKKRRRRKIRETRNQEYRQVTKFARAYEQRSVTPVARRKREPLPRDFDRFTRMIEHASSFRGLPLEKGGKKKEKKKKRKKIYLARAVRRAVSRLAFEAVLKMKKIADPSRGRDRCICTYRRRVLV